MFIVVYNCLETKRFVLIIIVSLVMIGLKGIQSGVRSSTEGLCRRGCQKTNAMIFGSPQGSRRNEISWGYKLGIPDSLG